MRKITLTLVLILIISFSYCQDVYRSNTLLYGKYVPETGSIKWDEPQRIGELTITFTHRAISIANKANSTYIVTGDGRISENETYSEEVWDAIDEQGLKCRFSIVHFKKSNSLSVYFDYSDITFGYLINL